MFMFRSRKTNLAKRLMKKRRGGSTGGTGGGNEAQRRAAEDEAVNESVDNLLKTLQENQLEMLLRAVDSRGQDVSNCVLVPQKAGEDPHVLCCQTWRWPDLRQGNNLRRLPMCRSACDPVYICCNPYHWSRLCQPETPPPPYSRTNEDRIRPEDRAPSEVPFLYRDSFPSSLTTDGDCCMNPAEWCKLAYWEFSERVGSMFVVDHPAVNVFGGTGVLRPDGLSLQILAKDRINPNEEQSIQKTRSKIGLGVTLWREDDCCVWVYNRSGYPIFVNSTTLEIPESPSAPTKVPEEHCLCVYDPVKAAQQHFGWNFTHPQYGPVDLNSIRISFVKGWGPKYSRQEITSCPCWLEILLAPCR